MKTKLIALFVLMTMAGQAMSMGHPHNLFAARKQMKAKAQTAVNKPKPSVSARQQLFAAIDKAEFAKRLLIALTAVRPTQSY